MVSFPRSMPLQASSSIHPLGAVYFPPGSVKALLTDIEGTTTAVEYVFDILIPYAMDNLEHFLQEREHEPAVQQIIKEVREIEEVPDADLHQVANILASWMKQNKRIAPLQALQGMIWEEGYKKGEFSGHFYRDAFQELEKWKNRGFPIYSFSNSSEKAQRLLFTHSDFGDSSHLFNHFFDGKIGGKKESSSYTAIADQIGIAPQAILFVSDSIMELDAAHEAGMQTLLFCRDDPYRVDCSHRHVMFFYEIILA